MYQNGICWGNGVVFLSKTYFSSLIKRENTDPVAMHFYTNEHTVDDNSVKSIEKLYTDEIYRKFREKEKENAEYLYAYKYEQKGTLLSLD